MPGLAMESINREGLKQQQQQEQQGSPRSPLSHDSPPRDSLDIAIDGVIIDTSIEHLFSNVCDMQSSDEDDEENQSSLFSYGRESRIDSELRHLVGENLERESDPEEEVPEEIIVIAEEPEAVQTVQTTETEKPKNNKNKNSKKKSRPKIKVNAKSLIKKAKEMMACSGESNNLQKALEIARRATKSLDEDDGSSKNGLDLAMSLHVSAALLCALGRHEEAIPDLERSIEIAKIEEDDEHALAKFSGCMQLGDTYAMIGQIENSLMLYSAGMEIQRQVIGETDPRFGETCRYVAEANVQALQFDEAERICRMAIEIHRDDSDSPAAAFDRRLMGLICGAKGDHEAALEHYVLASAAMVSIGGGREIDVAAIDRSIGDAYLSMGRYDEAAMAYRKSLAGFRSSGGGENQYSAASVLVRLADLHNKIGQFRESRSYCEEALSIYNSKRPSRGTAIAISEEEITSGLVDVSAIYQSMNELDRAVKLLKKALKVFGGAPGQQSTAAGIEAQIGVMYYMMGSYKESYEIFKSSVLRFRAGAEKKSALFGIALNQMGLACVQLCSINEAAELFEEAKEVLEKEYGPCHPDTLGVCSNLAGTYDAMGRLEDAIEILEYVVETREEKLGTANPEVDDEKRRLGELLKETGRARNRKLRSLETLLDTNNAQAVKVDGIEVI